jgi:Fe(3+) dicitrate transport protein
MLCHRPALLALAIASALPSLALAEATPAKPHRLDRTVVAAEPQPDPRFSQVSKEIDDGQVLAGKKSTTVELAEQPAVANNELRQTFVRVPGLLVSEQQVPSHFNVNYRGLGDPHESEFVMFFEDGVPLASGWFGYPTMYYLPPTERLDSIQFVRGGSSLLYGPQPGPAVNLLTRDPVPEAEFGARSRHIGGSDGLYSTYNELSGGAGDFGYRVELDHREYDGTRANADSNVDGAAIALFWRESDVANWRLDLNHYESESGEAGRLPSNLFATQPDYTSTPFNRIWIERQSAVLSSERQLADSYTLDARLWHSELERDSRRSAAWLPGNLPANLNAAFDHQDFSNTGLDARISHDFGSNHTLTFGLTAYHEDSPRWQRSNTRIDADSGNVLRYVQERGTDYAAVFAESIFRFERWSIIPALRLESLTLDIEETTRSSAVVRDAIDDSFHHSVPLAGLGATYDWPDQRLQAYGNLSQGYRPMRYDDVGNPTSNLSDGNDPDPSETLSAEFGLRGAPIDGLFFDVSLFHIDFSNKIEQIQVGPSEVERVNSGDARHQGLELAAEYDFLAGGSGSSHLTLFGSVSFLDAEITESVTPSLVGRTPAYAPDHVAKLGLIWRTFEDRLKLGLTGTLVDDQYWRDANTSIGTGVTFVAAEIPSYQVLDLTGEWRLNRHFSVIGGINNVTDETYTSRVRNDGADPGAERHAYFGIEVAL